MKPTLPPRHRLLADGGFTFNEALTVLSIIGVVGSMALSVTASAVERTSNQKLRSDVRTLNSIVNVYKANGGDLSTALDSQDVLNRLKSQLSEDDAARYVGLTSSMIDVRVAAEYQSTAEALTDQLRSEWDPSKQRFVLGDAGGVGIKRFYFDNDLSGTEFETETRSHNGFMYALEDEWIWDYEERPKLAPTEVTTVDIYFRDSSEHGVPPSTSPYDDEPPIPEPEPEPEPDPEALIPLTPPGFTPDEGSYNFDEFPMEVSLSNPNEPNAAILRYAINEGSFQTYFAPFTVEKDDIVRAYAATSNPERFMSSSTVSATYESLPEVFDGDDKGKFKNGKGNNGHGNNIDGVDVSNPGKAPFEDASGDFDDESNTAVVSYSEEGDTGVFSMGDPFYGTLPNTLKYHGNQFIQVEPEALFKVGTLEYYNSTVFSGTQADEVTLDLTVNLSSSNVVETVPIYLAFNNTTNTGTAWENADAVTISYRTIPLTQKLNGKDYFLVVQFGQATNNGVASIGSLKVLENKKSSAPVYGYFTTNPPG